MTEEKTKRTPYDPAQLGDASEDRYNDAGEKRFFKGHEGMAGFWRFMVPLVILLLVAAISFAVLSG